MSSGETQPGDRPLTVGHHRVALLDPGLGLEEASGERRPGVALLELGTNTALELDSVEQQTVRGGAGVAGTRDLRDDGRRLLKLGDELATTDDLAGGRVADAIDRDEDQAALDGFRRGAATREREHRSSSSPSEPHRLGYSAGLGGGPIWMRSPMYEPMSVKSTPMAAMITYMKSGIVRTVCPRAR
jgi:hypothetical protein